MKSFACADMGWDCDFTAEAKTEDELMKKVSDHAKKVHNMDKMDEATSTQIKSVMKDTGSSGGRERGSEQ